VTNGDVNQLTDITQLEDWSTLHWLITISEW